MKRKYWSPVTKDKWTKDKKWTNDKTRRQVRIEYEEVTGDDVFYTVQLHDGQGHLMTDFGMRFNNRQKALDKAYDWMHRYPFGQALHCITDTGLDDDHPAKDVDNQIRQFLKDRGLWNRGDSIDVVETFGGYIELSWKRSVDALPLDGHNITVAVSRKFETGGNEVWVTFNPDHTY